MKNSPILLSFALFLFFSFEARAQDSKSKATDDKQYVKSYVGFLVGASIPTGNFGQTVYSNNSAGFAKKGVTLGLDGAVYVYKNLAIGATFSFQDQGELNMTDVENLSTGYNTDFNKDRTDITAVNRYHNFNLMGGPQYSVVFDKLTLDLRASAGVIKSTSTPSFIMYFDNSTNSAIAIEQHSSEAKAFAYGGSAGVRYSFGDTWDIGLKANYVNSDGLKVTYANDPGTTGRFVTKLPVSEIQTALTMTVSF